MVLHSSLSSKVTPLPQVNEGSISTSKPGQIKTSSRLIGAELPEGAARRPVDHQVGVLRQPVQPLVLASTSAVRCPV